MVQRLLITIKRVNTIFLLCISLMISENLRCKFSISISDGNYSKDSLAQAFVKFLEAESRPRSDTDNAPSLLSMNTAPSKPSTSTDDSNRPANTSTTTTLAAAGAAPVTTAVVQPILLPDAMLQTFNAPRNSSSILKDILNDS